MILRFFGVLLAVGLGAVDAGAVMRVFFTSSAQPYGLTDPNLAFQPTLAFETAQDATFYQVAAFPPLEAWGQTPMIDWEAGEFGNVWVRFDGEPDNRRLRALLVDVDGSPADVAYYVMNDTDGAGGGKRWDGAYTGPDAPEFENDPQILAAIVAVGIENRPDPGGNWNLYDNVTRTALLGAVRYASDGLRSLSTVLWPPGPIPPPPPVVWEWGQANWIPEPSALGAALALCAAAGRQDRRTAARRRRKLA